MSRKRVYYSTEFPLIVQEVVGGTEFNYVLRGTDPKKYVENREIPLRTTVQIRPDKNRETVEQQLANLLSKRNRRWNDGRLLPPEWLYREEWRIPNEVFENIHGDPEMHYIQAVYSKGEFRTYRIYYPVVEYGRTWTETYCKDLHRAHAFLLPILQDFNAIAWEYNRLRFDDLRRGGELEYRYLKPKILQRLVQGFEEEIWAWAEESVGVSLESTVRNAQKVLEGT